MSIKGSVSNYRAQKRHRRLVVSVTTPTVMFQPFLPILAESCLASFSMLPSPDQLARLLGF